MLITGCSLFAGIGGFDLAMRNHGINTTAAVEIDTRCRDILTRHFPHTTLFTDIKDVTGADILATGFVPRTGIITGGFPCQDVSVAGKRAGLAGSRSGLFWEAARIIEETQPRWVIIENVPGLLSSNSGRDMGTVVGTLGELGYGWAYRVLDAQYFGVPQRRRRVFIVAGKHSGSPDLAGPQQVLLERSGMRGDSATLFSEGPLAATSSGTGAAGGRWSGGAAGEGVAAPLLHGTGGMRTTDVDGGTFVVEQSPWGGAASMTGIGWWNEDTETTSALAAREYKDSAHVVVGRVDVVGEEAPRAER